jgi:selenium metabolism protein YedF
MAVNTDVLLLLTSSGIGEGEPDLGEKLMKSFLAMLLESGTVPERILLMNSGIFLSTEGSPVLETLQELERQGARIHTCGTCLDYYGRKDLLMIGEVGNMRETVSWMLEYGRILKP